MIAAILLVTGCGSTIRPGSSTTTSTPTGATPGSTAALQSLSCASSTVTTAGTDPCSVTLTTPAPSGGVSVALASDNKAVAVPASINIAAGSTTASFKATVKAVTGTQKVSLTATEGGATAAFSLQLGSSAANPAVSGPALTVSATSVAFGSVTLNTPATQSIVLTSSGTAAVTVQTAKVAGTGFTMAALKLPLTLSPGQTATVNLQFDPTAAAAAAGTLVLTSNSASGGTTTVQLSGTGVTATYAVDLSWGAPSSTADPAAQYDVYRAANGGNYQLLTSVQSTAYTDPNVNSGSTYSYYVTSVDSAGAQSPASNVWSGAIP